MGWDGSGQITSGPVVSSRFDPSRVVGAGGCVGAGVHEGGGSRAASAESRIENRNRSRCLVLSCLPLQAGPEISPASSLCASERTGGPARLT